MSDWTDGDWTDSHAQLHGLLRSRPLLPADSRILIAVSGGQDSLCLAKLLSDLQPKWRWQLAIVHCDHRWRPDSAANAAHVQQLARQWQLPSFCTAAAEHLSSEAAARAWRYQVFATLAQQQQFTHVVTGHTATDRAETVLYNLLRGSGLAGLQSLTWQRPLSQAAEVQLIRPLLGFTRAQTGHFCQLQQLPVWEDATNRDLSYRRNRIRHELMPYLRSHFNPQVESALAQTAEIFSAEQNYLDAQTEQLYQAIVQLEAASKTWCISRTQFRAAPLALRRRLARRVLLAALPQVPQFEHIEKLVRLAEQPNRSQTDPFPGGLIARVENSLILIAPG
ncbi:MAG: tRNA lysidine(34) synthetase TilS [Leptolyngbya sp. SIO4C1]|nr:tRNA lysidine(34) synthetase TilS [Leptolyngbya sp. SIO4C1]